MKTFSGTENNFLEWQKFSLTPSSRQGRLALLERIRKRFSLENENPNKKLGQYGNLRKHSF